MAKKKIQRLERMAEGEKLVRMNFMTSPTRKKKILTIAKERMVTPSRIINEKLIEI